MSKNPRKDIERINAIYERLSESGRIMMLAYSTGIRDKEMVAYKVEQDCYDNRVPLVTLQVKCNVNLETGAIPLLPEPWSWYYMPKHEGFTSNPPQEDS